MSDFTIDDAKNAATNLISRYANRDAFNEEIRRAFHLEWTTGPSADWIKPRARSVYFSIFIRSFPQPAAPPEARSAKVATGFASDRASNLEERTIRSPNRLHFGGSCAWHGRRIFIGFPHGRIDMSQPAAVASPAACAGLRQMWEAVSLNGRGRFTNSCAVAPA